MHSLRFMRCRPCVRRPAASGRRGPLRLHSKAPHRSPSLRLSSRYALRSMPPIGRHHCVLRSRRRAPANGSGDVAVSPDTRLQPRVGAATPERSFGSRSRSPRLSRGCDTLRLASGMPGSTLYVQSHLGVRNLLAAAPARVGPNPLRPRCTFDRLCASRRRTTSRKLFLHAAHLVKLSCNFFAFVLDPRCRGGAARASRAKPRRAWRKCSAKAQAQLARAGRERGERKRHYVEQDPAFREG